MMVNSFCWEFFLQSHAALHREFLLALHTLCWFMQGAHKRFWFIWRVSLTCPVLVYEWSFSFIPHAGFFLFGVSLIIRSMLASLCREFLLYKTKRKNVKVNKNVHNWVMLLFKAEVDIQCRLHKVASCLPADSAEINTKHDMSTC